MQTVYSGGRGGAKTGPFLKFITPAFDDLERCSMIHIFFSVLCRSKTGILNVAIFKYYLNKFREVTLH